MKSLTGTLVFLLITLSVFAQDKFALVIGIKSYQYVAPLQNPVNDAHDIASTLKTKGFQVIELYDAGTKRELQDAVRKYFGLLQSHVNSVGLVFYSGHGMQIKGSNYLIPAKADLQIEADLDDQCLNMDYVMSAIEQAGNPLNVFILDACRNNPFRSFSRSTEKGLSMVNTPKGSYIVYATKPGSVASDGTGRNGLFTSKLLQYMNTEGLNIEQVFKHVAGDVAKASGDAQRPWIASDYTGDFYFTPGINSNTNTPAQPVVTSIYTNLDDVWQQYLKDTKSIDFKECVKCKAITTEDYRIRSRCYFEMNDYQNAILDLTTALGMDPSFGTGYSNRAACYNRIGKYEEALADANKSLELSGGKAPWDFWTRAEIRYNMGDYRGSLADADKAIQSADGYFHSYILKWKALTAMGDKENARKALLAARDLYPTAQEVIDALRMEGLK